MEAHRTRSLTRRKPLSDRTNTTSSSLSPNPIKPNNSSSFSSPAFNKPPTKCTSSTDIPTNLDSASNPSSPPPTSSLHGSVDLQASEPISIFYSRRRSSNKRKDKGKAVAVPVSRTPNLKVSNSREKSDGFEGANLLNAKAMTVPCRKKQRVVSSENDVFKDPLLQDFIEKQKAYFKTIDEFNLSEEEVESIDELD